MNSRLIEKYNVPGPRYTSYPTVPYWNQEEFTEEGYLEELKSQFHKTNGKDGVSLYLHLPFCESLCTFCGCNKRITRRHEVEAPYIAALLKEWKLYIDFLEAAPKIAEIHLGGGTPTFFSPEHLDYLLGALLDHAEVASEADFSFEGHPNNTTEAHLEVLFRRGFRRVSYGVQDYNLEVQRAINRIQPFTNVERATQTARKIGYSSVGHDLIFGLPFQTLDHVRKTMEQTMVLMPDRIAFYSYAHVPWIKGNGQRGFQESDLPTAAAKREMYQYGKKLLSQAGYIEIGMDHFALPSDSLYRAMVDKKLHRNFMGYTTSRSSVMIGLGVSAISDCWSGFAQNLKRVEDYYAALDQNQFPIYRGHLLTVEDQVVRKHILNLMCDLKTSWRSGAMALSEIQSVIRSLEELAADGIVQVGDQELIVQELGRGFIRNVCMAFDLHLKRNQPQTQLFSMTV